MLSAFKLRLSELILSCTCIGTIIRYLKLREQSINTEFSEDERNTEEIDFVKAVIQGLIDLKEDNTYSLEEAKRRFGIN
jgi:hypothetical protein